MLVLALDTSTPTIAAGVVSVRLPHEVIADQQAAAAPDASDGGDGRSPAPAPRLDSVLAERTVAGQFAHAEQLMPLVQRALDDAGHRLPELAAVVVGLGPGPFTGLRVGIATAQALGDALDIPVFGVPSHDGMAAAAAGGEGDFLVVTDARRREVYLSGYRAGGSRSLGPLVAAPSAVPELVAEHGLEPRWFTGAGTDLLTPALPLPARSPVIGLGQGLVRCALRALLTGAVPGPLTPLYLRRPDATPPKPRAVPAR